jgi:hypothetical protein
MTPGSTGLFLKYPVVFALEWPGQIRDGGRMALGNVILDNEVPEGVRQQT